MPVRSSVSGFVVPSAKITAPPVVAEFWQPCRDEPELPHGHAVPVPSPKQNAVPVPSQSCHSARFHAAIGPACVIPPAAYRSAPRFPPSLNASNAVTNPFVPVSSGVQLVPSQRAVWFATMPPAVRNSPPAYICGPPPWSNTVSARTSPSIPLPNADQLAPFQRAIRLAGAPPAVPNAPPAASFAPEPSSKATSANTGASTPLASADQEVPFQRATR